MNHMMLPIFVAASALAVSATAAQATWEARPPDSSNAVVAAARVSLGTEQVRMARERERARREIADLVNARTVALFMRHGMTEAEAKALLAEMDAEVMRTVREAQDRRRKAAGGKGR